MVKRANKFGNGYIGQNTDCYRHCHTFLYANTHMTMASLVVFFTDLPKLAICSLQKSEVDFLHAVVPFRIFSPAVSVCCACLFDCTE